MNLMSNTTKKIEHPLKAGNPTSGGGRSQAGYIIPHTHWDREWRYPIWKNRMLLVEFMQELLGTLDTDPDYRCFVMDGQVAPIEDYLEVVPQDREKVVRYLREGRIAVGPWYTLPDLYPLDGECLVRNLLKGIRICRQYGGHLQVGYNSFGWGQTAQFPQIYHGFGLDFIVCAKRVSEERAPESEFLWEAPDGTRVLTSRLGKYGRNAFYYLAYLYSKFGVNCLSSDFKYHPENSGMAMHNAAAAHCDEDFFMIGARRDYDPNRLKKGITDAWAATEDTVLKSHRLLLNGTDFSTPHPELSRMIRDLNALDPDRQFSNVRLEEYAKVLHESLDKKKLRVIQGELRDGPACDCSGNALAVRAYLKALNKKAQNVLLHKAEPMAAVLRMLGRPLPQGFFDVAWKYLLDSHPHDSINGVTQDKTADDVENRIQQALEIGNVAFDKAVAELLLSMDLSRYAAEDTLLVVFNPHLRPVRDVVKACVAFPQEAAAWNFTAEDCEGNPVQIQEISRQEKPFPVHDMSARPWPFFTDRHLCYLDPGEIPAMGYKVIRFKPAKTFRRHHFYFHEMRKSTGEYLAPTDNVLENEFLRAEINPNGTLKLTDKAGGQTYDNLHYFEDTGDVGNYWAYYPPYHNQTHTTLAGKARCWCEDNGPLSATLAVEHDLVLPAFGHEPTYGVRGESKRSEETVTVKITSWITLKRGARKLDIRTRVVNTAANHRLRVAFSTGIKAEHACASGHFTVDRRPAAPVREKDGTYWPEMQTLPMQHFVDVSDGKNGLALLNNCLTEYELRDDERSTLYLTLFRAVNNMITTWWEAVGVFPDQKGSQLLRTMDFEYSIYPHAGDWAKGNVYREAALLNVPLAPYQVTPHGKGTLPEKAGFLSLSPDNLIVSALKQAEDRQTTILRVFNPTSATIDGELEVAGKIKAAWLVNLNEERASEVAVLKENRVRIQTAPGKIVTLELQFA